MPNNDKILYVVLITKHGEDHHVSYTRKPKFALKVAQDLRAGLGPNTGLLAERGTIQTIKIVRVQTEKEEAPKRPDIVYMLGMRGASGEWQELNSNDDFFCPKFRRLCEADET